MIHLGMRLSDFTGGPVKPTVNPQRAAGTPTLEAAGAVNGSMTEKNGLGGNGEVMGGLISKTKRLSEVLGQLGKDEILREAEGGNMTLSEILGLDLQRAVRTSMLEAAGAGRPPLQREEELQRAIEFGLVEPLSSLPTSVQGVPVKGRERLMEVFKKIKPILGGRAKTVPDIFKTIPRLPANTPDLSLPDPNPPRLSAMSVREFFERIRRAQESGI